MGNRCLIATEKKDLAVYLHWNGGIESVAPFLKYCELQGYRPPEHDSYGWARLCQVIGNFFGGGNSIGISKYYQMSEDNGTYYIENWQVKGVEFWDGERMNEMLKAIDSRQPLHMQLGEYLEAKIIKTSELKKGDFVWVNTYNGFKKCEVLGFGENMMCNGKNVEGIPFVGLYENDGVFNLNINNYITTETANCVN